MKETYFQNVISFTEDSWKHKEYIAIRLIDKSEFDKFIEDVKNNYDFRLQISKYL